MKLAKADIADVYSLQELSIKTFMEAFAEDNSDKDMQVYIRQSFASKKLASELNNPDSEFYIYRSDVLPVAYLKVNFGLAQSESMGEEALELERIYVLQTYKGKGVGQFLLDKAIEIGRSKKAKFIWLGVWEHNHQALAFYRKNGFEVFGQHVFQFGNDPQTDLMMRLSL